MHKQQESPYEQMIWNQRHFPKKAFFKAMAALRIVDAELTQTGFLLTHGDRGWLLASPVHHNGDMYRRTTDTGQTIFGALSVLRQFGLDGFLFSEKQVIERALSRHDFKRIKRPSDPGLFDVAMLHDWPGGMQDSYSCAIYLDGNNIYSMNPEPRAAYNQPPSQFEVVCQLTDGALADALRARIGTPQSAEPSPSTGTGPPPTPPATKAANDLSPPPSERIATTIYRILRDTELARRVKVAHGFCCQICGNTIELADGSRYAEAHHIQPLGTPHDGHDIIGNILCLCPNHHAELDYFVVPINPATLRHTDAHPIDLKYVDYHNRLVSFSTLR